ncbi:MAG: hypothetical protein JWN93_2551 [Hyphomicrobiales bacterium]|nr:hypothetical protein [Hyphomicrobiales bacterium]
MATKPIPAFSFLSTAGSPKTSSPQTVPCDESERLRLIAMDDEDLAVVSCHMQDALVRVGDMAYLPNVRRFALVAARFDWCASVQSGRTERARTGLHFEGVTRAARTGFDPALPDAVLNVLSIAFEPTQAPAGVVKIVFSGGAALRLEVECLEAQLHDMGERWMARAAPVHKIDDDAKG